MAGIESSNITSQVGLNSIPNQYIDKTKHTSNVATLDKDDALKISINEIYNKKRDELSHTLQSLNDGIAITQISLNGLEKQDQALRNAESHLIRLETSGDYEANRYDTAEKISSELNNFINEAQNATFKKRYLLDDQYGDEITTIVTDKKNYTLSGLNTKAISQDIFANLKENTLSSTDEVMSAIENVRAGAKKIGDFINLYKEVQADIKQNARSTINEQINLLKENSSKEIFTFGQDMANFTKNSVNSNLGYLAASQAHIIQEQSSKLLA